MIKQNVRGVVFFENKKREDVVNVFGNFRFDEARFSYFDSIEVNGVEKDFPGVYLNGKINEKYTSENVVRLFRKLMRLSTEQKNYDISVEREYEVMEISNDRKFNYYFSIELKKTVINENKEKFTELIEEGQLSLRDVGYKNGEIMTKLEIFLNKDREKEIKEKIRSLRIDPEERIKIKLI